MRLILLFLLVFSPLLSGARAAAGSQWESACESEFCAFRKTLAFVDSKDPFALVELLIDVESGESSFVVTTPLGINVTPGVRLITAGQDWTVPFRVCYADGCRATLTINGADLSLLLQNDTLEIRYLRFGEKRPVAASLPLDGLVTTISQGSSR